MDSACARAVCTWRYACGAVSPGRVQRAWRTCQVAHGAGVEDLRANFETVRKFLSFSVRTRSPDHAQCDAGWLERTACTRSRHIPRRCGHPRPTPPAARRDGLGRPAIATNAATPRSVRAQRPPVSESRTCPASWLRRRLPICIPLLRSATRRADARQAWHVRPHSRGARSSHGCRAHLEAAHLEAAHLEPKGNKPPTTQASCVTRLSRRLLNARHRTRKGAGLIKASVAVAL